MDHTKPEDFFYAQLASMGALITDTMLEHNAKTQGRFSPGLTELFSFPYASPDAWMRQTLIAQGMAEYGSPEQRVTAIDVAQVIALMCPYEETRQQAASLWSRATTSFDPVAECNLRLCFADSCLPEGTPTQEEAHRFFSALDQSTLEANNS